MVLVLGFEKMSRGSLSTVYSDRANPLQPHILKSSESYAFDPKKPFAPQLFGNAGREHMRRFGTTREQIAKIAIKNHKHSVNNPYSQFRDEYSIDQVLNSPQVHDPLTKLQCCPTSDGAAAAILVSDKFAIAHGLSNECVEIVAQALTTDLENSFKGINPSPMDVVGYTMTETAAREAYKQARIGPHEVQVAEVHDCFSAYELITYEGLGFCPRGKAGELVDADKFTYGGSVVVNPSGGLISKGHPLGATGLAQCAELVWQLRDHALKRQVQGVKCALQHNLGLGGACVVTIYMKFNASQATNSISSDPSLLEEWERSGSPPARRPIALHSDAGAGASKL